MSNFPVLRVSGSIVFSLIVMGTVGCGDGSDASTGTADTKVDCAQESLMDGPQPASVEEVVNTSESVFEGSVVRVYEEEGRQFDDETSIRHLADLRVDLPYKGDLKVGDVATVYTYLEMSNPKNVDVAPAVVGGDNEVIDGTTAMVGLIPGVDGKYEFTAPYGAFVHIEGDAIRVPGLPQCEAGSEPSKSNQFRDSVAGLSADQLREQVKASASSTSTE